MNRNTRPAHFAHWSRVLSAVCAPSLLLVAMLASATVAIGQCGTFLQSGGPMAGLKGDVRCSTLWDPDGAGPLPTWLVAGGLFLTGGNQTSPEAVLAFDGSTWRSLGFSTPLMVTALTVFNGDLIAAGNFSVLTSQGIALSVARLSGATWFQVGIGRGINGGMIHALAVFGGELYAGGAFSAMDNISTGPLAKFDGSSWSRVGSLSQPFNLTGTVYALETLGTLYVGGAFSLPFGAVVNLGNWNGSTWSAVGNPNNASNTGFVNSLSAINGPTHATSFLFAAGSFTTIGGVPVQNIARAPYGAASWSAMGAGLGSLGNIHILARTPFLGTPEVLATGQRASAAVNPVQLWTGSSWVPLGSSGPAATSLPVSAPQHYGTYVVGVQSAQGHDGMFRLIGDWVPFYGDSGIASPVECLVTDGLDVIVGGAFFAADGHMVNGIARRSGGAWTGLGTGMTGGLATVKALARRANGDVFAGGDFTTAGGNAASNVARWNGSAWVPLGAGTNGTVRALLIAANGDLIAGGDFTSAGGVACNHVARWNGTAWMPMASGMDGTVDCLAESGSSDIVAGGGFLIAGGVACNRIARWNGIQWSTMAGGMDGNVYALTRLPNGTLVAGGAFTVAGGNQCPQLARWNGSSWGAMTLGGLDAVKALAVLPDGDLLIGGTFSGAFNRLARWDATNTSTAGIGNGLDGPVFALASLSNGDVFIGGDFDKILPGQVAGNLAILSTNCPASATPVPTACVGPAGPVTLIADTLPWMGSTFRSTATGFAPQALAASVLGFFPNNLPLSAVLPVGLPNCNLLASSDAVLLTIPQAGVSHYQLALPNTAVFAGVQLSHQFVQLGLSQVGAIQSLSSSNALTLVLGLL